MINNYVVFNAWANQLIIERFQKEEIPLFKKEIPSSFKTIDLTMQHMVRTQKFWLAFICQENTEHFDWSVKPSEPYITMKTLEEQSVLMKEKIALFSEEELQETLWLNMSWAKNKLPRYEYILHVVNHSTFHRGQLITMARVVGITENLPGTDYNFFNSINSKL